MPSDSEISETFQKVDSDYRAWSTEQGDPSGSTIVGCLAMKQQDGTYSAKICNAGDSRGLIIAPPGEEEVSPAKLGVSRPAHLLEGPPEWPVIAVSIDHKPDYPPEEERIKAAGGFVSKEECCARLDGSLAVSRGLGDFEYKQAGDLPPSAQKVSCIPDIYEVHGLKEGTICVLACDGLWDVMSTEEVAQLVREQLKEHPKADLGVMCSDLVHKALRLNSRDNITVMIVQMVDGTEWSARSGRFNESDEMTHFDKMIPDGEGQRVLDAEMMGHYESFLKRCKFPMKPVQCSISGRWYSSMFLCSGTGNTYMSRHYQKKGWTRFKKNGGIKDEAGGQTKAKAASEDADEAW